MLGTACIGNYGVDGFVTVTAGCDADGSYRPLNVVEEVAGVPLSDVLSHLEACINGQFDLGVPPTKEVARSGLEAMFPTPRSLSKRELKRRRERDPSEAPPEDPPLPTSYGWDLHEGRWVFRFRPSPLPAGHIYLAAASSPRRTLHIIDPHLSDSLLRALVLSPRLGELVAGATGWGAGQVRVMESQLWLKPPRCGMPLAFHRDTPYFNFLADVGLDGVDAPVEVCTLWITFDDISTWDAAVSRGALEYVKGSHRWVSSGGPQPPLWRSADNVKDRGVEGDGAEEAVVPGGGGGDEAVVGGAPRGLQKVFFDADYHSPMHSAAVQMYKSAIPPTLSTGSGVDGGSRRQRAHQLRYLQQSGYLAPPSTTTYPGCEAPPLPPSTPPVDAPPAMTHLVQLPAGGCTLHNGNTWHGSGANSGTTHEHWRRGIGIHYVKASARFKACYSEDSAVPPPRPLSAMWAGHKQPGTLQLSPSRFPVVY